MKNFFKKPFRWAVAFSSVTVLFTAFVLLDTFVIPRAGASVITNTYTGFLADSSAGTTESSQTGSDAVTASSQIQAANDNGSSASGASVSSAAVSSSPVSSNNDPVITATSYKDNNISITIETVRENGTNIYIADITVSSVEYLKTAFAQSTYGRNIKESTSVMAEDSSAVFAINGDYYGFRDYGFVLRNGVLYRNTAGKEDGLAIDSKGTFSIIDESSTSAQSLVSSGTWQVLTFGPALINNGQITVTAKSEVDQAMVSNPRTAVGMISPLHYIFIVSDGRTSESTGLSLLELAQVFISKGCTVAYNLDGGGSATMWFNGQLVNKPTTNGNNISERSISDIVYIGYK